MRQRRPIISVFVLLFWATALNAFAAPQPPQAKQPDYSADPFVVQQLSVESVFQDDGKSSATSTVRVKIQSQAAVKEFGSLSFPYASAVATLVVDYVRVTKPDGRMIKTPAENILEMPTEITREAPFYSDIKEKQVAVKGLEVGDLLEYQYHSVVNSPIDPGQFWFAYNFFKDGICLDETLKISVPRNRQVTVESGKLAPVVTQEGAYKVYTWKSTHLESTSQAKEAKPAQSDEKDDDTRPSIRLTSFANWDDFGQWIRSLFAPRAVPSTAVKAKADELTRGAQTDLQKIQALYKFVSQNFRYIGISLGVGRIQPHSADDVLSNDYGDCKDKHTLLAALLAAENIQAFPALVDSTSKNDPDIPSPSDFDHVITAIPQGAGFLFLDATPEVAPFGYLSEAVRDKEVLVVPDHGEAKLVRTPIDPPFKSFFRFQADGTLDDKGTFNGKMSLSIRGDAELPYRLAFRNAGKPQWDAVMQQISSNLAFGGTVSNVTVSPPEDTEQPFVIQYSYSRKDYGDWENGNTVAPFPPVFIPRAPESDSTNPLDLGTPMEMDYQGTIKLPPSAHPVATPPTDLHSEFADYHSSFSISNGVLHFERRLLFTARQVPAAQLEAYRTFSKDVVSDVATMVSLNGELSSAPEVSGTPEARAFYQQGTDAWQQHNLQGSADAFQSAVEKDPKFAHAWFFLGYVHLFLDASDQGITEMAKAISLDPSQIPAYKSTTSMLSGMNRIDDALRLWRALEIQSPGDLDAHKGIASILISQEKYTDALPELQSVLKDTPDDSETLIQLGDVFLHTGQKEKGIDSIQEAVAKDSSPLILNNAAYTLAENSALLDDALQYAERAVRAEEDLTLKINLDHLTAADTQSAATLAAYWDTLGWVQFRLGHIAMAKKFIYAAWIQAQMLDVSRHLQEIYEKEDTGEDFASAGAPLQDDRTVKIRKLAAKHVNAQFSVLLGPGAKVVASRFMNGSDELRGATDALVGAAFKMPLPDDHSVRIFRTGFLDCEPELPNCIFVLIPLSYGTFSNGGFRGRISDATGNRRRPD
ncbi:MAG TPA: DUF3857 domain-containing protein [Candidatus Acidoferrales bacterium]|nr:DUF3857 domain-containing protein [Candidatus Acidoferrales bacterium]